MAVNSHGHGMPLIAPSEVQVAARSILAAQTMSAVFHLTRMVASATPERHSWATPAGAISLRFSQAWRQSCPGRGDILRGLRSPVWPVDVT